MDGVVRGMKEDNENRSHNAFFIEIIISIEKLYKNNIYILYFVFIFRDKIYVYNHGRKYVASQKINSFAFLCN